MQGNTELHVQARAPNGLDPVGQWAMIRNQLLNPSPNESVIKGVDGTSYRIAAGALEVSQTQSFLDFIVQLGARAIRFEVDSEAEATKANATMSATAAST